MSKITPDGVGKLTAPTDGFLCALSDNKYGIEFMQFVISDYESKKVLFSVDRDTPPQDMSVDNINTTGSSPEDRYRRIRYQFSEDVLRLPNIETSLVFKVGRVEVRDFRMIERHYFRGRLVKSFDFSFGYCIPGSTNTWDAVYSLPALDESLIADMIASPYETRSDSFYFVGSQLVMHNKSSYAYLREDAAQAKRSYESKFGCKGSKGDKCVDRLRSAATAETKLSSQHTRERKNDGHTAAKSVAWSKDEDYT